MIDCPYLPEGSMANARIAIVGGGKMGEAIMGGWIKATNGPAAQVGAPNFTVVNPGMTRREYLRRTYQVICIRDASELAHADIVVLSVKPQVMMDVLPLVSKMDNAGDALFISVAAGLGTKKIEAALPEGARLVRVMPNTPLLLGQGATTLCAGSHAGNADVRLVADLFGCIGESFVVSEEQMDATGAVNGSGPAYVAALVEALAQAGEQQGLNRDLAERLAAQTVYGTGMLMTEGGQSAEKTRIDVCSPGGTTLAALAAMEESGFTESVIAGVTAAVARSKELGA